MNVTSKAVLGAAVKILSSAAALVLANVTWDAIRQRREDTKRVSKRRVKKALEQAGLEGKQLEQASDAVVAAHKRAAA